MSSGRSLPRRRHRNHAANILKCFCIPIYVKGRDAGEHVPIRSRYLTVEVFVLIVKGNGTSVDGSLSGSGEGNGSGETASLSAGDIILHRY